jgi:hypothetical protein
MSPNSRPHWGPFPRAGLNYQVGTEHLYLSGI